MRRFQWWQQSSMMSLSTAVRFQATTAEQKQAIGFVLLRYAKAAIGTLYIALACLLDQPVVIWPVSGSTISPVV